MSVDWNDYETLLPFPVWLTSFFMIDELSQSSQIHLKKGVKMDLEHFLNQMFFTKFPSYDKRGVK